MGRLKEDSFTRRGAAPRRGSRLSPLLFALGFLSLALLVLSRIGHPIVSEVRLKLSEVLRPLLTAASVPLEPVRRLGRHVSGLMVRQEELERLQAENQKLKGWEWRARELERKLAQLSRLANVVEEPGIRFVTARVIADARGPFVRTAMLDAGREQGVKSGFPAISADGLVGRIVEPSRNVSRLLLLTDLNSRIPVLVGQGQVRAMLMGDNGPRPRLAYMANAARAAPGDEVYTSGVGGLFPRGLRIGTVVEGPGGLVVVPHARLDELDFVSVLQFEQIAPELADDVKPAAKRASAPVGVR